MSRTQEKDRRAERRKPFALALMDDHLAAIGQVALRGGMLDNLIELTAEQLIQRQPPVIRKELSKFSTVRKIELIKEALTLDMPECSHAIAEFFSEIGTARTERNEIVHRTWRTTDTDEVKALVRVKHNEPEELVRRVTAESMIALANRLLDLAIELGDWKMTANNANLRRSAKAPGMPTPVWPLNPPRKSAKDIARRSTTD
jgi:hypothetical protein